MKLVVCEGNDDKAVIEGVASHSNIKGLTIEICDGRNNLERYLRDLPKRPEFVRGEVESLAVIIDAETNAARSWDKIWNAVQLGFGRIIGAEIKAARSWDKVRNTGQHGSGVNLSNQTAFFGGTPKIAGMVIGGGEGEGMIEDLCLKAVSDQPGYQCLEDYFKCLSGRTGQMEYHSKSKFNAWMASQSELGLRVGKAAEKGHIPWGSAAFDPLRQFLQSL